jgi:hypothetical protein
MATLLSVPRIEATKMSVGNDPTTSASQQRELIHLLYAWTFAECYAFVMDPERLLLSIEGMDTSCGDSTEKPKFEKVDSFAFKKFETIIILCVALAIGASEAAAMSMGQASETRQNWREDRQIRQNSGDSGAEETHSGAEETRRGVENPPAANDSAVTNDAMTRTDESVLELPRNLRVPENMRPMLMRMLRTSATFRRQIAYLAAKPAVRVSVMYGGMRGDRNYHALSTVRKHEWGAIVVDTQVFVPTDLVEIIAHELEHVCEQIEGVDLRSLSRIKGVGVYDLNGHFETSRAIRAGQEATREYHDGPDPSQQPSQQIVRAAY